MGKIFEDYFGKNGMYREESPNVFYMLGVLYGNFSVLRKSKKGDLGLRFSTPNYELAFIVKQELRIPNKIFKHQTRESYQVVVANTDSLVNRLSEIGILEKRFPEINSLFIPDFARGYFDCKARIYDYGTKISIRVKDEKPFLKDFFRAMNLQDVAARVDKSSTVSINKFEDILNAIEFIYSTLDKPYRVVRKGKTRTIKQKRIYLPQKKMKLEEIAEKTRFHRNRNKQPEEWQII